MKKLKQTEWISEIRCPFCGEKHEPEDVLPYDMTYDGEHEDNITCDNCGNKFDCYLSVTYEFKTYESED
jgi:transcription elongation factor Elf1